MPLLCLGATFLLWGGGLLLGGLLTNLSLLEPSLLDSALFSPLGSLFLAAALTAANGGYLLGGLWALLPYEALAQAAPVPSSAPLHVFGLLGAGYADLSTDASSAVSPIFMFWALLLGGLWSRKLGPHREIWSWDVVEITALDLFVSEACAEHLWTRRPAPAGVLWGGGEVRLFRAGLAASHHHLSTIGIQQCAPSWWLPLEQGSAIAAAALAAYRPLPTALPQPLRTSAAPNYPSGGGPLAAGEASLVAWASALFAPSSGAISAWGLWGAPLYLWLTLAPLWLFVGPGFNRRGLSTAWTHAPALPLAHVFATPLPWGFAGFGGLKLRPNGKPANLF